MSVRKALLLPIIMLFSLLLLNGCSEETNPINPPSEHFEPEGWLIRDAALQPVLVVFQGQILKNWKGNPVPDTLFAPLNALSEHFSVKFLDANQNIMNPPSDASHSFTMKIADTSVAGYKKDTPTDYAFHLIGKKIGKTDVELQVQHSGHVDVKTPLIPLVVRVDTTAHGEPVGMKVMLEENDSLLAMMSKDGSVTGSIVLGVTDTTDHIKIVFFDEYGTEFSPEVPHHSLGSILSSTTIASVLPEPGEPWVVRIVGKTVGTASVRFTILVSGTAEFTSSAIPILVQ